MDTVLVRSVESKAPLDYMRINVVARTHQFRCNLTWATPLHVCHAWILVLSLFCSVQSRVFFFFFFQINHVPALMVLLVNEINFRDKLQSTQVEKNHTFVHDLKRVFIAPFGKGWWSISYKVGNLIIHHPLRSFEGTSFLRSIRTKENKNWRIKTNCVFLCLVKKRNVRIENVFYIDLLLCSYYIE